MNVTSEGPIDTSDSEESMLEEDPELEGDLRNFILVKRGEDQPCPERRAADSAMDTPAEAVAGAQSPHTTALLTEEDPELVDDCRDGRGKDQPCPVGTAADSAMDTLVDEVTSTPSPDVATLPTEEALGETTPPSSSPTKALETQGLSVEDAVVPLHEEEMTNFP